ncbi:MAG: hypothetical protein COY40_05455 [Alphaproteobacteria bacterium CG_4_10_14_0_8_um_filter_53_9]|nr:MAG: hypothetical protein COY40_05455 [Alphaproteobacteria bacterium CG_4_10_14_0_8_um_filter_53_9]
MTLSDNFRKTVRLEIFLDPMRGDRVSGNRPPLAIWLLDIEWKDNALYANPEGIYAQTNHDGSIPEEARNAFVMLEESRFSGRPLPDGNLEDSLKTFLKSVGTGPLPLKILSSFMARDGALYKLRFALSEPVAMAYLFTLDDGKSGFVALT